MMRMIIPMLFCYIQASRMLHEMVNEQKKKKRFGTDRKSSAVSLQLHLLLYSHVSNKQPLL